MKLSVIKYSVLLIIIATALSGCATHYTDASVSDPYGFFSGIIHGAIFPFVLVAKICAWILGFVGIHILDEVQFVGRPNSGFFFYYVGYVIGLSSWNGASSS